MKNILFSLLLCATLLGSALSARASDDTVVQTATPFSPPCVNITNELSYSVRIYALANGRRYFMAQLTPGEHLNRRMAPPVSGRNWLITTTGDERIGRLTLTTDANSAVLR